ncbi:unnamed protein product, partial [Laminaria digitata]
MKVLFAVGFIRRWVWFVFVCWRLKSLRCRFSPLAVHSVTFSFALERISFWCWKSKGGGTYSGFKGMGNGAERIRKGTDFVVEGTKSRNKFMWGENRTRRGKYFCR